MREMREMMEAIVQERNTSRNPGERGEAHRVISEGYASSDFDSVQSGELPLDENVRPTGERVGVDLPNPSADAPACVRVQFSDGMAHGSAEPPHGGDQTGIEFDDPVSQHHPDSDRRPLNQNYKERVRRECHKLAAKSEIFTGKSSQEITIASLHRDIEDSRGPRLGRTLSRILLPLEVSTEQIMRCWLQSQGRSNIEGSGAYVLQCRRERQA
ncbi:hypothetical protein FOZ62_020391 [Perkinsus olseni]|uniref:Uncharacterized protein n=1 Tax=Perkinsus olseni TaxID=32597 RepID=A0A7J6U4M1_PEROL|nr:hypothetical protein FOZ62_020391 [Perkinsus olseni]